MKQITLVGVLAVLSFAVPAHATLETISYAIGLLPMPPASLLRGKLTSNTYIFLFLEQQGVTLTSPIAVDITAPGTYTTTSQLPGGLTIPAGTKVNSYYFHANPASGQLTFTAEAVGFSTDEIVIGVELIPPDLAVGVPVVGLSTTTYNSAKGKNGLHLSPNGTDSITISSDQHTVTVNEKLAATTVTEFRLITQVVTMPGAATK